MNSGKQGTRGAYTFLRDEIAAKDAFGSHERLASVIAGSIIATPTLRFIGLLGPWGSGKSTVVGFLKTELAKDRETHLFTYDAWLHQSDPPRRSFLESFINFLVAKKLTTHEKWANRVDQLNGRVQESVVTKTPQLTAAGRAILTSLLGAPLGWTLVFKAILQDATRPSPATPWLLGAGVTLAALPLLVALAVYLTWRPTWSLKDARFLTWKNWTTHKADKADEVIFSLFLKKQTETTRDRITKDPEPTSIEFQKTFRELMAEANSPDKPLHRILIVVDNLDRLPESEGVALWSTIRSFFLGSELSGHAIDESHLPTVVLPVDVKAIERLYDKVDKRDRTAAFLEKTFDATFQVNRPVFAGWRKYLRTQMTVFFGNDLEEEWVYVTGRILDRAFVDTPEKAVTPRSINSLINRMGTQWMLRLDPAISFAAVAYYCVFQPLFEDDVLKAVLEPRMNVDLFDPDWTRGVAAIHFGVSMNDANELLLDAPIRSAIERNARDAFGELAGTDGFAEQMARICSDMNADQADPTRLLRTMVLLGTTGATPSQALDEAWRQLRKALPRTARWTNFGDDENAAISLLLERGTARNNAEALATVMDRALASEQSDSPHVGARLAQLWNHVADVHPDTFDHVQAIAIGADAESYLRFVAGIVDNPKALVRVETTASSDAISAILVADMTDVDEPDFGHRIRGVIRSRHSVQAAVYADTTARMLSNNNAPIATKAMLALGLLRGVATADQGLKALFDNARMQAVLLDCIRQADTDGVARAIALFLAHRPAAIPNPPQQWSVLMETSMPNLVERTETALAELVVPGEVTFKVLADCGSRDPNLKALTGELIRRRLDAGIASDVPPDVYLANVGVFGAGLLPGDDARLLREVAARDGFWSQLDAAGFVSVAWPLMEPLIGLGGEVAPAAVVSLGHHLQRATADDWSHALNGPTEWSNAAGLYARHAGSPEIAALFEPLKQALGGLVESASSVQWQHWFALAPHLSTSHRQVLMRSARDRLLLGTAAQVLPALQAGGDMLLADGSFMEKADEVCRELLPTLLGDASGLAFLTDHAAVMGAYVAAAQNDSRAVLLERLVATDDPDAPLAAALATLRASWASA